MEQRSSGWLLGLSAALGHHLLMQHLTDCKSLTVHLCRHLCPSPSIYIATGAVIVEQQDVRRLGCQHMNMGQKPQVLPGISAYRSLCECAVHSLSWERNEALGIHVVLLLNCKMGITFTICMRSCGVYSPLSVCESLWLLKLLFILVVFLDDARTVQDSVVFTYVVCIKRRGQSLCGAPEHARDIEPVPKVGLAPVPRTG